MIVVILHLIQLGIILNNMWHMGQVFVQWGDIVPPVKEGEKDNTEIVATHTKLSDEIKDLLESFDREVRSKISTIVMMIIEKVWIDNEVTSEWTVRTMYISQSKSMPEISAPPPPMVAIIGYCLSFLVQLRPDLERRLMELLDLKEVVIPPNYDKMAIDPQDIGVRAGGLCRA